VGDYAAAPSEPIVQGLITIVVIDTIPTPVFSGRGISSIIRTPPGVPLMGQAAGDYLLTLDEGLPGDVALDPIFGRSFLTVRGAPSNAIHFSTTIDQKSISYVANPAPGVYVPGPVPGLGSNVVRVVLTASSTAAPTDPTGTAGNGCEIVIWRGNAGPDDYSSNLIGPLFEPILIS
jgi:hypothetical protein